MPKSVPLSILLSLASLVFCIFIAQAQTPPHTTYPEEPNPSAGLYTLSDIYNKISSSTYEYSSHDFTPPTTPASTLNTLSDIWNTITWQTLDNSGTLAAGLYEASSLETVEPNLIAANIATGTTLFGVVGTCADPCDGTPVIGTVCAGGALYLGGPYDDLGDYIYMTTPTVAQTNKVWSTENIATDAISRTDGSGNTTHIMTHSTGSDYPAAEYCSNLFFGGYDDWYLPAIDELDVLYMNKDAIGASLLWYFSSTEYLILAAWNQYFDSGTQYGDYHGYKSYMGGVRCVRKY